MILTKTVNIYYLAIILNFLLKEKLNCQNSGCLSDKIDMMKFLFNNTLLPAIIMVYDIT